MKFALRDSMVERASGRIKGGQQSGVAELWTFVRGPWLQLAAFSYPTDLTST